MNMPTDQNFNRITAGVRAVFESLDPVNGQSWERPLYRLLGALLEPLEAPIAEGRAGVRVHIRVGPGGSFEIRLCGENEKCATAPVHATISLEPEIPDEKTTR